MPLASSRDASRKRASSVSSASRNKKRLSLPATISSATSVGPKNIIRRRQSLSRQNSSESLAAKENAKPGTTPYYVVAEERGGEMSPRITRSAKKNKLPPSMMQKGGGVQLTFSPPDQAKIRQMELDKEEERRSRVETNRAKGQLLEFDMNSMGQDYSFPDSPPKADPPTSQRETASDHSTDASSLTESGGRAKHVDKDDILTSIKELMQQFKPSDSSGDNGQIQLLVENLGQQNEKLGETNQKLEIKNDNLQTELKDTSEKWQHDKNEHLVATTRLQTELKEYERHANKQIDELKQAQMRLEEQLTAVRGEKTEQLEKCHRLEQEIAGLKQELDSSKSALDAFRQQMEEEKENLGTDYQQLLAKNSILVDEINALEQVNLDVNVKVKEYEAIVDSLQKVTIPKLESKLEQASKELAANDESMIELTDTISCLKGEIEELKGQILQQQSDFDAKQDESARQVEVTQTAMAEKDAKIGELFRQLGEAQQSIFDKQEESSVMAKRLGEIEQSFSEQLEERDIALEFARRQLEESEEAKRLLSEQLESLELELSNERIQHETVKSELEQTKERAEAELHNVQGLTEREQLFQVKLREMEQKLHARERELKTTQQERDDARTNMAGFNERENELYRKLHEGALVRRDLHARVMQLAGNIRVFVRVRPPLPHEITGTKDNGDVTRKEGIDSALFRYPGVYDRSDSTKMQACTSGDDLTKNLILVTEPHKDRGGLKERRKQWKFGFDSVFSPEHGQEDVWDATEPLVQSAVDGFNVTIFAYGQTGSGKTYTMLGEDECEGLIGRAVRKLFGAKHEIEELSRGSSSVCLSVELLEVYNEKVFDLLGNNAGPGGKEISLKVTSKEVVGNTVVPTASGEDVMKVLALAQSRRCVKATASNKESSRSHMIFTIHFAVTMQDGSVRQGKLNVCDLAGSERLDKSGTHHVGGALLEETKAINKSLSTLSNVIERLQAGDKNIPFRESKLTFLLQDSLGGNSKTLAIICCNPLSGHFHESLCSLRFAEKVNKVDLKAVANFSA
ncbi:hypothetical protein MPSEU_000903300 [Mayamaea pseudoterrestris]|nr:hypothetical protein MPSEU_000903300 [Mayamaea pseudoterrestris]